LLFIVHNEERSIKAARELILASTIIYEVYVIAYWALHFNIPRFLPFHIEVSEGFLVIIFLPVTLYRGCTKRLCIFLRLIYKNKKWRYGAKKNNMPNYGPEDGSLKQYFYRVSL